MATPQATATVSGSTEKYDTSNKRYTVYTINVNYGNKRWTIYRRYNEFQNVYDKVSENFILVEILKNNFFKV